MKVRDALQNARPHVALRAGFKVLIQRSRALRKKGEPVTVKGRPDIDRFLSAPLSDTVDPNQIKSLLWTLLHSGVPPEEDAAALALNAIIAAVNGPQAVGDVTLQVSGGPSWLSPSLIDQWLGTQNAQATLSVRKASAFAHHLHGYMVGGRPLDVQSPAPLPAVSRADRGRRRTQNTGPWLPYVDEVGRYSATPKVIAEQHARYFSQFALPVLDPFCGLGGDAIAFAQQGLEVHAAEMDRNRMALAQKNAAALAPNGNIQFYAGDGLEHLKSWATQIQDFSLYLDPPWGGTEWDRNQIGLTDLFPDFSRVDPFINQAAAVIIKLPRAFQTDDLNALTRPWEFRLGVSSFEDHVADRLRMISAMSSRL